jgi:orotate phosphoribosyltransferase
MVLPIDKKSFIQFCIDYQVIKFGDFTLKSGRKSPYFFNTGLFNTGQSIAQLGRFYADAIVESDIQFDILFGPAYKGIPLVISTAIALAEKYNIDKPVCFNRKTEKDHGEGGMIVGAQLKGKILLIDDVITAGTAVRESVGIFSKYNEASFVGMAISLDRNEKGTGNISAVKEIENTYGVKMISIITLNDLIDFLQSTDRYRSYFDSVVKYREIYGAAQLVIPA